MLLEEEFDIFFLDMGCLGKSRTVITVLLVATVVAVSGCRRDTLKQEQRTGDSKNRERALQYYIEGSIFDQKGDYARAILEYQEALRYDNDPAIYYAISKDYKLLGKHYLAAEMGQEAVSRAPENRTYRQNLADIYANAFEIEKAIAQYEEMLRLDSTVVNDWYNLARLYQYRKPLKAIETYRAAIERFGPNWDVYSQLAALYSATDRYDSVAVVLGEMLQMDPGNYELQKSQADALLQSGKNDTALKIYGDLLERNPQDFEIRAAIAHIYLSRRDYEHASDELRAVLASDSLAVETQLRFGQIFASYLQKDSASAPYAYQIFQSIQKNYPADWRPRWFLGVVANIMNNDSAAVANFEAVTQLAPTNPDGWVYLASLYLERRDYAQTVAVLERAKNLAPEEFRVHFLLGVAYQRMKRHEDAIVVLEHAVRLNPKDMNALSALALSYEELKRYQDCDRIYEEALKIDPHSHLVLNNYGYSLAERGERLERALTMATEAVRQQPENPSYLDTIGWVYFKLGQYDDAERFIRRAVENGEASPVVLEHLGDVYAKLGKKDKALEFWRKALERDSSNQQLKDKIERGSI